MSYLDSSLAVQENTSIQYWEFPQAAPLGTPSTSNGYFPVLPSSCQGTDTVQYSGGGGAALNHSLVESLADAI